MTLYVIEKADFDELVRLSAREPSVKRITDDALPYAEEYFENAYPPARLHICRKCREVSCGKCGGPLTRERSIAFDLLVIGETATQNGKPHESFSLRCVACDLIFVGEDE